MIKRLLIDELSTRHPGLTTSIAGTYAEAAAVCFTRFHATPIDVLVTNGATSNECEIAWVEPDVRTGRAWANEIDATEAGAYGVSLAAVEEFEGLVAVRRAETLTGADYYIAPAGTDPEDLESCIRLEVSGVSAGNKTEVLARLRTKLEQASKGASNLPAMASVIGFKERLIAMARLGEQK